MPTWPNRPISIGESNFAGRKLNADDTPIPVLSPGSGKTKTGHLWTYVRDDRPAGEQTAPAVWFAYSEDRKGEHPRQHLKNFRALCRQTPMPGSIIFFTAMAFTKLPAGRMPDASSMRSMSSMPSPQPPKHWPGSGLFMRSRMRSAASLPITD